MFYCKVRLLNGLWVCFLTVMWLYTAKWGLNNQLHSVVICFCLSQSDLNKNIKAEINICLSISASSNCLIAWPTRNTLFIEQEWQFAVASVYQKRFKEGTVVTHGRLGQVVQSNRPVNVVQFAKGPSTHGLDQWAIEESQKSLIFWNSLLLHPVHSGHV